MDELIFTDFKNEFKATGYNIQAFVEQDVQRYLKLKDKWIEESKNAEFAMVWTSWLRYFPYNFDHILGLIRENKKWLECLNKQRDPDLMERMKERDSETWLANQLKLLPATKYDVPISILRQEF
jgi:hypothetical protein